MKKNISILSIALLAGLFAAGCGKLEKCEAANDDKDKCAKADSFKEGVKCAYQIDATDAKKGKCMKDTDAEAAFKEDCNKITSGATDDKCKAVADKYVGVTGKCEFKTDKCEYTKAAAAN